MYNNELIISCNFCDQKIRVKYRGIKLVVKCPTCTNTFCYPEDDELALLIQMQERINQMSGIEFEKFVKKIFDGRGYETGFTRTTGDQGIDIIAKRDDINIGIQCKRYNSNVGNSAVQEALSGKAYYHLDKVFVVTNNYFTQSAIELAKETQVALWDGDKIKEVCKMIISQNI